ncbi:MAG TPA: DUF6295 family protein [Actinomycetes bacterium]|nr:DUF6295 family protein [Actinomycetes bacterium]
MCTYHTERVEVAGSGKGPDGWFPLRLASVYFDHPQHTPAEHTLNIDFLNPGQGPSARVAVELSEESALALADAIHAALAATALEHQAVPGGRGPVPGAGRP